MSKISLLDHKNIYNRMKREDWLVEVGDKIIGVILASTFSLFLEACISGSVPQYMIAICVMIMIMVLEWVVIGVSYQYYKLKDRIIHDELNIQSNAKLQKSKYQVLSIKKLRFFCKIRIFILLLFLLLLFCYMVYIILKFA